MQTNKDRADSQLEDSTAKMWKEAGEERQI